MSKGGFSVADLQKAQKKLNSVEVAESKTGGSAVPAPQDSKALHSLEELYESHGGDLNLMCVCRGCPRTRLETKLPLLIPPRPFVPHSMRQFRRAQRQPRQSQEATPPAENCARICGEVHARILHHRGRRGSSGSSSSSGGPQGGQVKAHTRRHAPRVGGGNRHPSYPLDSMYAAVPLEGWRCAVYVAGPCKRVQNGVARASASRWSPLSRWRLAVCCVRHSCFVAKYEKRGKREKVALTLRD